MTGPWKAWKTKGRFSTLPTFPQPRQRVPIHPAKAGLAEELATLEKWKSKSRIPTFPAPQKPPAAQGKKSKTNTKGESRRFTTTPTLSGSFFDWKMLAGGRFP
jgi:hypothetical protein